MDTSKTRKKHIAARIFFLPALMMSFLFELPLGHAQPTYAMQNALVNDCEGTLTDSDNGPETGQYDHNELYTFTVCVDNATEIIIAFNFFFLFYTIIVEINN